MDKKEDNTEPVFSDCCLVNKAQATDYEKQNVKSRPVSQSEFSIANILGFRQSTLADTESKKSEKDGSDDIHILSAFKNLKSTLKTTQIMPTQDLQIPENPSGFSSCDQVPYNTVMTKANAKKIRFNACDRTIRRSIVGDPLLQSIDSSNSPLRLPHQAEELSHSLGCVQTNKLSPAWKFWHDFALRHPATNAMYLLQSAQGFNPYHVHFNETNSGMAYLNKAAVSPQSQIRESFLHAKGKQESESENTETVVGNNGEDVCNNERVATDDCKHFSKSSSLLDGENDEETNLKLLNDFTGQKNTTKGFCQIDSKKDLSRSSSRLSNCSSNSNSSSPTKHISDNEASCDQTHINKTTEENNRKNNFSEPRKKKTRTVFSRNQIFQLESTFDLKRYLSSSERAGLAATLNLTETQIKIWFQNRRNKWKRQIASDVDGIGFASTISANPLFSSSSISSTGENNQRYAVLPTAFTPKHQPIRAVRYPTISRFSVTAEQPVYHWPKLMFNQNNYVERGMGTNLSYYPRAMMVAAVAAAASSGRNFAFENQQHGSGNLNKKWNDADNAVNHTSAKNEDRNTLHSTSV